MSDFKPTDYPDVLVPINGTNRYIRKIKEQATDRVLWIKKWQLTTSAGTGGSVNVASQMIADGGTITITATPSSGYKFVSWQYSNSLPQKYKTNDPDATERSVIVPNGASIAVTMKENVSIGALFERNVVPMWMLANKYKNENGNIYSDLNDVYIQGLISKNNGDTWESNHWSLVARCVAFTNGKFVKCGCLYRAGQTNYESAYSTSDGGASWSIARIYDESDPPALIANGLRYPTHIDAGYGSDGTELWLISANRGGEANKVGLYYSRDSINWYRGRYVNNNNVIDYNGPASSSGNSVSDVSVGLNNCGVCLAISSLCNTIWLSVDNGVHWAYQDVAVHDNCIATDDGFLYLRQSSSSYQIVYVPYSVKNRGLDLYEGTPSDNKPSTHLLKIFEAASGRYQEGVQYFNSSHSVISSPSIGSVIPSGVYISNFFTLYNAEIIKDGTTSTKCPIERMCYSPVTKTLVVYVHYTDVTSTRYAVYYNRSRANGSFDFSKDAWRKSNLYGLEDNCREIAYGNGCFMIVMNSGGYNASVVYRSTDDGATWSQVASTTATTMPVEGDTIHTGGPAHDIVFGEVLGA